MVVTASFVRNDKADLVTEKLKPQSYILQKLRNLEIKMEN